MVETETIDNKVEGTKENEPSAKAIVNMFLTEMDSAFTYETQIKKRIKGLVVPTTEDGKRPDIEKLIDKLKSDSQEVAKKYLNPDGKDPQWTPDDEALRQLFKQYENILDTDGKLREAVAEALINAYIRTAQEYTMSRGQGRGLRAPLKVAQEYGTAIATHASDKALVPLIEKAKTPREVVSAFAPALNDTWGKAKQWYELYGKTNYPKPYDLPKLDATKN